MRIASVLHDASPEPDGAPLLPAVALERDGALYRVSALARAFGARYAALADEADFRHTVVALGGAPLRELDERLKAGERPSSARLLPGTFTWLPPCDTERAAFFACAPHAAAGGDPQGVPAFRIGSARAFLGHDSTVPVLHGGAEPDIECGLAVVLADDLWRATAAEAGRAILGYSVLVAFAPGLSAQLGPVLVTRDEAGPVEALRTQLRIGGAAVPTAGAGGGPFSPAASIAWISHHVPLCAGDVIGAGCVRDRRASALAAGLAPGASVDFTIERLGRLVGRCAIGPEMRAWRGSPAR